MSLARKVAVGVLGILLTTSVSLTMFLGTAHLTVLDPDFVTNSLEEEDGYELVLEQMEVALAPPDDGDGGSNATGFDQAALLRQAIGEEYLADQTEANVDRLYGYLHGNRATLNLSIDVEPVKSNASETVESEIRNASLAELLQTSGASLPGPVDAATLDRLTANESSYRAAKAEFRASIRDRVVEQFVDEAVGEADDDELLALVIEDYDPDEYTDEEKAQMVEDRESEIRAALTERVEEEEGDRIDSEVDAQLDRVRESTANASGDTEMEQAAIELQTVVVTGLTTDTSYETFSSDLAAAKADFAAAAGEMVETNLQAELPDRIDLTEDFESEQMAAFETARTGVQWLDGIAIALPLVLGGILGLLYLATGSVTSVASTLGASMLWTGLPAYLGLGVVRSRLASMVAEAPPQQRPTMELMAGVTGRVLDTVGALSLAMTIGGVVLFGAALAVKYGAVERVRDRLE